MLSDSRALINCFRKFIPASSITGTFCPTIYAAQILLIWKSISYINFLYFLRQRYPSTVCGSDHNSFFPCLRSQAKELKLPHWDKIEERDRRALARVSPQGPSMALSVIIHLSSCLLWGFQAVREGQRKKSRLILASLGKNHITPLTWARQEEKKQPLMCEAYMYAVIAVWMCVWCVFVSKKYIHLIDGYSNSWHR